MIHNNHAQCLLASIMSSATAAATSPYVDIFKTIGMSVVTGLITWSITQLLSAVLRKKP